MIMAKMGFKRRKRRSEPRRESDCECVAPSRDELKLVHHVQYSTADKICLNFNLASFSFILPCATK